MGMDSCITTEVNRWGTAAAYADAIEKMKREMRQLERLRGSKVIVEGDTLITLYHETQRHGRRDRKRFRRQP